MTRPVTARYAITSSIMDYIFQPVVTYLSTQIVSIAEQNKALLDADFLGFNYHGENFAVTVSRRQWKPSELHKSLHAQMDALIKRQEEVAREMDYIRSYVAKVTQSAKAIADYFALFPDALHSELSRILVNIDPNVSELTQDQRAEILQYNQKGFDMVKNRLLKNLLI